MVSSSLGSREEVERRSRSKSEPAWLLEQRLGAWDKFERLPMPSRADEEWRRTDIRGLKLQSVQLGRDRGAPSVESPLSLTSGYGGSLVQSNGFQIEGALEDHIRESGVVLSTLDDAVRSHPDIVRKHLGAAISAGYGKFAALNGAAWAGGVFVYVPRGVDAAIPLRALYGLSGSDLALCPRTLIVLEDQATLTYVEEYASNTGDSAGASLSSGVVEIFLGQDSRLTLVTLQEYGSTVYDINAQRALLGRDASLDWLVIGLGAGLTKSNIDVAMQGQGARTQMLGILWGYGGAHTNYQTLQDHQAPNCTSDLLYKGALTDEAVSVFSGKIRVEKGAQRTDSYQANRTVILSDKAATFPSPNLEIEANDVRCTHGASIGKVDAEQLFYLMSRGLSAELATKMIVEGFFEEVLGREPGAAVRDNLRDLIRRKIEERAA